MSAATQAGNLSRPGPRLKLAAIDRLAGAVAVAAIVAIALASATPARDDAAAAGNAGLPAGAARFAPARETFVGVYGGAPYTYPSDVAIKSRPGHGPARDFVFHGVPWDGEPFRSPVYYGARVARWFDGGWTGAMVDFTHSKAIARLSAEVPATGTIDGTPAPETLRIGDFFKRFEFTHGHNMLTLNGLLRLPSLWPRVSPYVGVGAGIALPHTEIQMQSDPHWSYEYQYAGLTGQALIGLEFRFRGLSYFLEYKFTFARMLAPLTHQEGTILPFDLWRQFQRWMSGTEPDGGTLQTTLASHQVISGVGLRFEAPLAVGK